MRINRWVVVTTTSMILALFVFCSNKKFGESDSFLGTLMMMLKEAHYEPKPVDDQLSEAVYGNLINNLDRDKHFFTEEDLAKISVF